MMVLLLLLSAEQPVFVDERAEIPWIVAVQPSPRCGELRKAEGPKAEKARVLEDLKKQPAEMQKKAPPSSARLPLLPTPGLLGLEGELLVVVAEKAVGGPVSVVVDESGAWLLVPEKTPADAFSAVAWTPAELQQATEQAAARLARRRASIGAWATEKAQRYSCFQTSTDPALPLSPGPRLRARLSAPILGPR